MCVCSKSKDSEAFLYPVFDILPPKNDQNRKLIINAQFFIVPSHKKIHIYTLSLCIHTLNCYFDSVGVLCQNYDELRTFC